MRSPSAPVEYVTAFWKGDVISRRAQSIKASLSTLLILEEMVSRAVVRKMTARNETRCLLNIDSSFSTIGMENGLRVSRCQFEQLEVIQYLASAQNHG